MTNSSIFSFTSTPEPIIIHKSMPTNSKQISPGELSVGMFITVLENKPFVTEDVAGGVFCGG